MKQSGLVLGLVLMMTACSMRPTSFEGVTHAKPQTVASLIGQTQADIHTRFGVPTLSRNEQNNTLWSYQSNSCALLVFFDEMDICRYAETRGKCQ